MEHELNVGLYLMATAAGGFLGLVVGGFLGYYACRFFTQMKLDMEEKEKSDQIDEC